MDSLLILCSGLGVGVLMGLSVSPVLHIIVASIITLVVGVVSAVAGFEIAPSQLSQNDPSAGDPKKSRTRVMATNPLPITTLVLGLVIGACAGIYMRTNEVFGANPQRMVERWKDIGLEDKEIKRRIFDKMYPDLRASTAQEQQSANPESETSGDNQVANQNSNTSRSTSQKKNTGELSSAKTTASGTDPHVAGLLNTLPTKTCGLLALKRGNDLRTQLTMLNDKQVNALLERCNNDDCLEAIKVKLCPK